MMNLLNKVMEKNQTPFDVLSLIFSNFATVSQKQQRPNLEKIFSVLSLSCEIQAKSIEKKATLKNEKKDVSQVFQDYVKEDLELHYPECFKKAEESENRGALRALTWGKKVTSIQDSIVKRFMKQGENLIKENEKIHVCEACGFVIIKDNTPEICPVCKAPRSRFVSF